MVTDELLGLVDLLVVNEIEVETLAKCPPVSGFEAAEAAAQRLLRHVPQVIVTLGRNGLVLASSDRAPLRIPGHAVEVESTHGAGDAVIGAFAARLVAGASLQEAAHYANAAAAALVATPEDARARLSHESTLALLARRVSDG